MPKIKNWSKVKEGKGFWEHDFVDARVEIVGRGSGRYYVMLRQGDSKPLEKYGFNYEIASTSSKKKAYDKAVGWMKKHPMSDAGVYRVYHGAEDSGKREMARYKANDIDDVIKAVKRDLLDVPEEKLDIEGGAEEQVYLTWTEELDQAEVGLTDEEWEDAKEFGETYDTHYLEIIRDDSASFPMNLITGESPGRDLTERG